MDRLKGTIKFAFSLAFGITLSVEGGLAETLTPAQAKNHIGETATVCGKVVSATFAERSRGCRLSSTSMSPIRTRYLRS